MPLPRRSQRFLADPQGGMGRVSSHRYFRSQVGLHNREMNSKESFVGLNMPPKVDVLKADSPTPQQ
jgi:hypothetical protein